MGHVIQVVAELDRSFFGAGGVALLHLRPARQAWAYQMPPGVAGDVLCKLLNKGHLLRARTDQAHVAAQHIPQLRDFIEPGVAQKTPQPRDARIGLAGKARRVHSLVAHAAQLVQTKRLPVQARAPLAEERRSRAVELDGQGRQQTQRQPQRQCQQHRQHIQHTLDEVVGGVAIGLPEVVGQDRLGHTSRQSLGHGLRAVEPHMVKLERGQDAAALDVAWRACIAERALHRQRCRAQPGLLAPVPGPAQQLQALSGGGLHLRTQIRQRVLQLLRLCIVPEQQFERPWCAPPAVTQPEPQRGQAIAQQQCAA